MKRLTQWFFALFLFVGTGPAFAQLADETQITPTVPGGTISKSLDEQVGAGHGDVNTPGSAVYLIKRDPARSIRRGRQLFQRKFTANQGLGPRVNGDSAGNVMDNPALGAGLSDSCAGCHGRPRGAAGFGGDVVTRPDSRDAPHLFGLGLKEMLADEMTHELRQIEGEALAEATSSGQAVTRKLTSKGTDFGAITVAPDGSADVSAVVGVDTDLRVRPFFLHGETASIREFIVGAFKAEMGLQSSDPILCSVTEPGATEAVTSPSGFFYDPTFDVFERPPLCSPSEDGDGDGVTNEIDTAVVDHLEWYLLNYFKPGTDRQTRGVRRGERLMRQAGCTSCHTPEMQVDRDRRVADVETVYDPRRGLFNRLFATLEQRFQVAPDGDPFPQLIPKEESFQVRAIYTDFKRHDLGPAFWERNYDGTLRKEFLTTPLWGVGSTAPYGHDGRSMTLRNVILRHGGEAERSRNRFASMSQRKQGYLLEHLRSLVLFPPDDTSSNLAPADLASDDIQNPDVHGRIDLGALFQISEEGPE